MSNFNHANVLDLIGVVYADGHMPVVVLPFMSRGDIRALIHKENEARLATHLYPYSAYEANIDHS